MTEAPGPGQWFATQEHLPAPGSTLLADLAGSGKLKVVAAIYDLETGVVTYID